MRHIDLYVFLWDEGLWDLVGQKTLLSIESFSITKKYGVTILLVKIKENCSSS